MAGRRLLLLLTLVILCWESTYAKKKPCKFNGKKFKAGKVVLNLEENCLELKCAKKGKIIEQKLIKDCTCENEASIELEDNQLDCNLSWYLKCRELSSQVDPTNCEDIEFRLYNSPNVYKTITSDKTSVVSSSLNPDLPLLVVVHGYMENADTSQWMHDIGNKTFEKTPMNVILLQWSKYADDKYDYCTSVQSTRCVGYALADLLNSLQKYKGLSPTNVTVIGFSLGAQVAGVAGSHLQQISGAKISKITGLDPAGPGFYNVDLEWRLDPSDANFVNVIHTNGGCFELTKTCHFGFYNPCGHVDFYVDGGKWQNSCSPRPSSCWGLTAKTDEKLACSHDHAHEYYIASMSANVNYGYQCANYETFESGSCKNNPKNIFGYEVELQPRGVFYLTWTG